VTAAQTPTVAEAADRRPALLAGVLFAVILVLYLLTISRPTGHIDAVSAQVESWQISHGSPWLDQAYAAHAHLWANLWISPNPSGHMVAHRSPGVILFGIPAYLVARIFTPGFSVVPGGITAALLSTLSAVLIYRVVRDLVSHRAGLIAAAAFALATPMWTVSADGMWPHTITVLALAGAARAVQTERWWLLGICGGIGLWGRIHVSVIIAILAVGLAFARRSPRIAVVTGTIGLLSTGLSSVWCHWLYDTWNPGGPYNAVAIAQGAAQKSANHLITNELGLFFSLDRGLFVWTPVLVVLMPQAVRAWRHSADWVRLLVVGGVVYTLIQGAGDFFQGGSFFYGYRLDLELMTCLVPLYALAFVAAGRMVKVVASGLLGLQFAAMAIGAPPTTRFFLPSDKAWTHNSFVFAIQQFPELSLLAIGCVVASMIAAAKMTSEREQASSAEQPSAPLVTSEGVTR
jgi:hypothetical protein